MRESIDRETSGVAWDSMLCPRTQIGYYELYLISLICGSTCPWMDTTTLRVLHQADEPSNDPALNQQGCQSCYSLLVHPLNRGHMLHSYIHCSTSLYMQYEIWLGFLLILVHFPSFLRGHILNCLRHSCQELRGGG